MRLALSMPLPGRFLSWLLASTLVLTLHPCAASRADTEPTVAGKTLMDNLIGNWVITGSIGDQSVTHDMAVDRILKDQYVRIHEVSREKDPGGELAYEAWIHIAWDEDNAEYAVMWLDNTAVTNFAEEGVGRGTPTGDEIPFAWRFSDGSGIYNVYRYDRKSDTWTWSIDNLDQNGSVFPFARLTLTRPPSSIE